MTKRESSNEQRILDGLRSGDPDRINQAYELLTENLVFYARSLLRTRFNQVNLQEGSIVQSAIASLVKRGADQFDNEDHLQGRMRIEVLRKIQDRIKARSNRSLQENDSGIGLGEERVTDGPGIATRIAEGECVFDARGLMLAGLDRSDRELVDLCLFQGLDSRKAGEQLGVAPEVIRQRLTRLRPRLRASLLEPVRPEGVGDPRRARGGSNRPLGSNRAAWHDAEPDGRRVASPSRRCRATDDRRGGVPSPRWSDGTVEGLTCRQVARRLINKMWSIPRGVLKVRVRRLRVASSTSGDGGERVRLGREFCR